MSNIKIININLPEYKVDTEPNHEALGKVVDDVLKKHFLGQIILLRGLTSAQHPDKTAAELIETIKKLGTDRYDPKRIGDIYENIHNKHIDLFAFRRKITPKTELFKNLCWGFYHSAIAFQGEPTRLDILTVYDAKQLKTVVHQYEGRDDIKRDGFAFKDPQNKTAALKAIIHIK